MIYECLTIVACVTLDCDLICKENAGYIACRRTLTGDKKNGWFQSAEATRPSQNTLIIENCMQQWYTPRLVKLNQSSVRFTVICTRLV